MHPAPDQSKTRHPCASGIASTASRTPLQFLLAHRLAATDIAHAVTLESLAASENLAGFECGKSRACGQPSFALARFGGQRRMGTPSVTQAPRRIRRGSMFFFNYLSRFLHPGHAVAL